MALNLLIVDDSTVMRSMILKTLRMTGLPLGEVHQAGDGAEGLQQLDEHWVDLCITDINMPVMDGMEMIAAIRADDGLADIPVIVVSTEGSQTRIDQLAAQGAKFIPKPFTPETVRNMVQEMLDTYGNDGLGGGPAAGDDTDF